MSTSSVGSAQERLEQLVVEFNVSDLNRSIALYTALGFSLERRDGSFAVLRFEDRRMFLDAGAKLPSHSGPSRVNMRVMVSDLDAAWTTARALGLTVERPPGDRNYGLRDFTVVDPDGIGIRFAAMLGEA